MKKNPWSRIGFTVWSLGIEGASVIGLRLLKIAAGGAAGRAEARMMIDEKIKAGLDLQTMALTGGLGLTPHGAATKHWPTIGAKCAPIEDAWQRADAPASSRLAERLCRTHR